MPSGPRRASISPTKVDKWPDQVTKCLEKLKLDHSRVTGPWQHGENRYGPWQPATTLTGPYQTEVTIGQTGSFGVGSAPLKASWKWKGWSVLTKDRVGDEQPTAPKTKKMMRGQGRALGKKAHLGMTLFSTMALACAGMRRTVLAPRNMSKTLTTQPSTNVEASEEADDPRTSGIQA